METKLRQNYPALMGSFALTFALAPVSWAQTTAPETKQATPIAKTPNSDTEDAPIRIVVTANKREQRLQDVPISVSVIDGAQLQRQNISEVPDLIRSAPALNSAGPFGALSIRGIGSISFARSAEGSVGVVVDNVALAGTSVNPPQLFDVSRVEVLEGPQGTLFGSNSSAGIINIVTNAPDPKKFEAIGHMDIGSLGNDVGRATLNIPLADNAALRASSSFSQAPKQLKNLYDNTWSQNQDGSARARLLWQIDPNVTINLIGDYTQVRHDGGAPWAVYYSTPSSAMSKSLAACGVKVGPENDDGCVDGGNKSTVRSSGYSGQVDFKLGRYGLTSITAYREVNTSVPAYDVDSTPVYLLNQTGPSNTHFVSQEIRLSSPKSSSGTYVAGLYYFNSKFDGSVMQVGPLLTNLGFPYPVGQTSTSKSTSTSYAAFADGTIYVTPELGLNMGVRYGSVDVHAQTSGSVAPGAVAPIASIASVDGTATDHYVSYRIGAQYDITNDQMAYASYTRGYKGPAINDQGGGGSAPLLVRPEIPHAAEIGLKNTFLSGRLAANVALYYTKVDDFQAQFYDPSISAFVFSNAPSLTSKGVEFTMLGKPSTNMTLNFGAAFNAAKYGAGYVVSCAQSQTLAQGCLPLTNAAGAVVGYGTDAGGNPLIGSPRWKATFSGEYVAPASGQYQAFFQADMVYTSRINFNAAYDPINSNAPATIFGGRVGFRTVDGKYGVSLFVRNLFDTYRAAARFASPTSAQQLEPAAYSQISSPESRRVVGFSLDARF
jgi:iron complex outermembrane receptor protein